MLFDCKRYSFPVLNSSRFGLGLTFIALPQQEFPSFLGGTLPHLRHMHISTHIKSRFFYTKVQFRAQYHDLT
jgi:hypothetical protein